MILFVIHNHYEMQHLEHQQQRLTFSAKTRYWCYLIVSCYIYATEELCHKGTLYKSYAEKHCQILFALIFQAANIVLFGDMVYNVLQKWPFISVMQSRFENQII